MSFSRRLGLGGIALLVLAAAGDPSAQMNVELEVSSIEIELEDRWQNWFAKRAGAEEDLSGLTVESLLRRLGEAESACRSEPLLPSSDQQPGSPRLEWRSLGNTVQSKIRHWFGAISCTDELCGHSVLHERLAILSVGADRATLSVVPGENPTIRWPVARIDSLTVLNGDRYQLLVAWTTSTSDHPCWDTPEPWEAQDATFVVLSSGGVVQAFSMSLSGSRLSWDVTVDQGSSLTTDISVTAAEVVVDHVYKDWYYPVDDSASGTHSETSGRIRVARSDGKFVRIE